MKVTAATQDKGAAAAGRAQGGARQEQVALTPAQAIAQAVGLMNAGKLEAAEKLCRQIVEARPGFADAWNVLGVILHRRGDGKEAVKAIRRAIRLNGAEANYYANVGEMLRQQGETDAAITALRRATRLDPESAQAFNNLGVAYFDKGKYEDAVRCYRRAIEIDPAYPEPHNNLGNALTALGRTGEAREAYEKALELRPDYAEALHNMATLLGGAGDTEEAEKALRRSIELQPDKIENYRQLANLLLVGNRVQEAIEVLAEALKRDEKNVETLIALARAHLKQGTNAVAARLAREAMELDEENPEIWHVYGQCCHELDRFDEAVEYFEKALEKRPDFIECRHSLAITLKSLGDFDRAEAELRGLIEKQPGLIAAYSGLTDMIKFTEDHPYFQRLREMVEQMGEADDERAMFLHYAIAKAYDDIGDYERAFDHYSRGAAMKRRRLDYDEEKSEAFFESIKKTYDAKFFTEKQVRGHPSTLPIFIVGMPRSGSTLTEQVLSSHPEVYGAGEIKVLSQSIHRLRHLHPDLPPFPELGRAMDEAHYRQLGSFYLGVTALLDEEAAHITDKLLTNYYFLGLIHKAFPNARIIHTMRNPVDCCLSCYTKLFKDDMPYTYDLRELGRYYRRYQALMEHWRQVLPEGVMLEVQYEEMVADFENKAKEIVAFCGLEWDEQCLRFYESRRPVKTASVAQVRKPIYKDSVERWRRYEKQLQPLLEELGMA